MRWVEPAMSDYCLTVMSGDNAVSSPSNGISLICTMLGILHRIYELIRTIHIAPPNLELSCCR